MKKTFSSLAYTVAAALILSACAGNNAAPREGYAAAQAKAAGGNCRNMSYNHQGKGRNEAYLCSAAAALNSAEAKEVLNPNIRVSYGNVGVDALTSRQVANAVGKTPEETCQRAFLNTVKRFQSTAEKRGSKAVRVVSYFDKKIVDGGQYECHIGTWHSRVVLKGNV